MPIPRHSVSLAAKLTRHPFLADVPANVVARLAEHARWFEWAPEQTILEVEDATADVYLIVAGKVRVSIQTANGQRLQILGEFAAGDLFGEMSAIDGTPRSARIEALVRTELCLIPPGPFLDAVFAARPLGIRLLSLLSARIRDQNRRILELTALPSRLRLAAELLRLGRRRPDGTYSVSPVPTQEELAARIGTARETISRELTALTAAGLVRRTRATIHLVKPEALRDAIEAELT